MISSQDLQDIRKKVGESLIPLNEKLGEKLIIFVIKNHKQEVNFYSQVYGF